MVSYAQLRGLAVGELVAMVEEEVDASVIGVPAVSFLAAHRVLDAGIPGGQST